MNVKNLRDNHPKLISRMETNGYSKNYVGNFKREIEKILAAVDSREWSCYTDVYLDYTKTSHSPNFLRNKRTIIGAIEQFDVYGRYLDGRRRHDLFERGSYPSNKKELTVWIKRQKKPCFQYLCPRMKCCSGAVLTKKMLLQY